MNPIYNRIFPEAIVSQCIILRHIFRTESTPPGPPRVRDVPKGGGAGSRSGESNHVEAVLVTRPAVSKDPSPGEMFDHPPFPPGNRFFACPESRRPSHLHFDERHYRAATHHQVNIVVTEGKAMGLQTPAAPA